jgi:hypothetical protein
MSFSSPMPTRVPVRRVAHERVTTERAILFTKEIVIHFGPASNLQNKNEDGAPELSEFKSWRAVRADRRLATTGAQNHDPDTSPCEWQTCFLLPKYLPRSG